MGLCFGKKNSAEKGATNTKASANSGETTKTEKEPAKSKAAASDNKDSKNIRKIEGAEDGNIRDKYIIGDELGRGGFSIVYKAVRRSDSGQVAVKIVQKTLIREDIKLLKREIEIMKTVNHPNILKLIEIYEDAENVYIVMELVDGNELFDRIVDRGYYSEKSTVHIVKQILEAIRYLHEHNIAHRDLKPENLLCSGEGSNEVVKIADFGLSKIFAGANGEPLQTSCGTPGYVAPEVLTSDSYDEAVDMWGVGIITYILLAGYPPWVEDIEVPVEDQIIAGDYEFHSPEWDDVSSTAKDWIRRLLVLDPTKRMSVSEALQHPFLKLTANPAAIKVVYADSNKPTKNQDSTIVKSAVTKTKSESQPKSDQPTDKKQTPVSKHIDIPILPDLAPIEVKALNLNNTEQSSAKVKPSPRVTSPRLTITTVLSPQRRTISIETVIEEPSKVKSITSTPQAVDKLQEKPIDIKPLEKPVGKSVVNGDKPSTERHVTKTVTEKPVIQVPDNDKTPTSPAVTDKPHPGLASNTKRCPKCTNIISPSSKFCSSCGHTVEPSTITSPTSPLTTNARFPPPNIKQSPVSLRFGPYKPPDHISHIPVIKEQAKPNTVAGPYKPPDHISHIPVLKEQAKPKIPVDYRPPDHITHIPVVKEQAQKTSLPRYVPPDHTTNIPILRERWNPETNEFSTVKEIVKAPPILIQKPKFPKRGQGRPLRAGRRVDPSTVDPSTDPNKI